VVIYDERTENMGVEMAPLYLAKIEDLGSGDFVKIDCAACGHTALLTPASLARRGVERVRVLDLKHRVRWVRCPRPSRGIHQMGEGSALVH
jgi:hypothetical protein